MRAIGPLHQKDCLCRLGRRQTRSNACHLAVRHENAVRCGVLLTTRATGVTQITSDTSFVPRLAATP